MSFKYRPFLYVMVIGIGCLVPDVRAMKRSRNQLNVLEQDATVAKSPIEILPEDSLRIIFAMANKAAIVQVCKAWNAMANFKENWRKLCDIDAERLVLDSRNYMRMYYLLLTQDDVTGMERLLSTDPYKARNVKLIAEFLGKKPTDIAKSAEMRKVLEDNHVLVMPNMEVDLYPASVELNEILLRNDDEALQQFIAKSNDTIESAYEISCFGTHQVIERLLVHWKKNQAENPFNNEEAEWTGYDEVLGYLMTDPGGSYSHTFNAPCRISILELLLQNGANIKGGEQTHSPVTVALYRQDYQALKLLCEYEGDVNDAYACCMKLDKSSGKIYRWWEGPTNPECDTITISPLMYGIFVKDPRIVALLLKHGADAFEINELLGDALEFAKRQSNAEIVDLIEVAQAVEKNVRAQIKAQKSVDIDSE
jgi:hypothetical protein